MGDSSLRLRTLSNLNAQATTLENVIDWEGATECIITCSLTKFKLLEFTVKPVEVEYLPYRTQVAKRNVKEVAAEASYACGADRGDVRGIHPGKEFI